MDLSSMASKVNAPELKKVWIYWTTPPVKVLSIFPVKDLRRNQALETTKAYM